ncbi:MAG: lasso peptide biosynthesis B2 protein [Spirochaetales bacterium]|nr:lasso peptide biosynthesis B2 protein [Spirochaetales bacterium]
MPALGRAHCQGAGGETAIRRFRKYLSLPREERFLLRRALLLVLGLRIALVVLPFGAFKRRVARAGRESARPWERERVPVGTVTWAVLAASRRVPGSTCLVQAIAARALLRRYGYQARLRLGVAKGDPDRLTAHAWLEHEGRIVIGGPESGGRYRPFPPAGAGRGL